MQSINLNTLSEFFKRRLMANLVANPSFDSRFLHRFLIRKEQITDPFVSNMTNQCHILSVSMFCESCCVTWAERWSEEHRGRQILFMEIRLHIKRRADHFIFLLCGPAERGHPERKTFLHKNHKVHYWFFFYYKKKQWQINRPKQCKNIMFKRSVGGKCYSNGLF